MTKECAHIAFQIKCVSSLATLSCRSMITTQDLFSTMISIVYTLLMAALDLAGIIFNIRMLRSCFKDKTKYTFLQKYRTSAICQCACQVIIVVADAAETWQVLETQPRESFYVFRVLSSSMLFLQVYILMPILNSIIYFDQPTSELCSQLKISAALSLGFTGSAMICCNSCSSQELIFQMALRVIFVCVAFVLLLFAWDARKSIMIQDQLEEDRQQDQFEDDTQQASMKTCSLQWKVFKAKRRPGLFISLLLV